ncbi:carbohydrate kinase family protein [Rhizobium sp. KVB221]|uniref:Carbohydrate kinase family protein n=1 Tax=Rhizobium setariae TaxID=2801340 RepID=A0A937CQF9_9HYPH|nr:carbohydrate kinase family protein [Rhizobium setariae]MBL0373853.1 carbohydrate kinase family protein [Rhizobium setariae]
MTGIAISGYASLDHVIVLDGDVRPGRTTTILSRPESAWPRLGGGPAYVAQAIAKDYQGPVHPVSWIGTDAPGEVYLGQLADIGISRDGMAKVEGARTPISVLAYEPTGDCACLYHPGLPDGIGLTEQQKTLVASAEWVCIAIGPKIVTDQILDMIRPDQKLAWIVKDDPRAITPEQTARLVSRADLIFCNGRERSFLESARTTSHAREGQTIVETQGRRGAVFLCNGQSTFVAAEPVDVTDPTGAGDTFAGGVIAAIMKGETELEAIGRAGNAAARALLLNRKAEETES